MSRIVCLRGDADMDKQERRRVIFGRFLFAAICLSFLCLCGAYATMLQLEQVHPASAVRKEALPTIVIDAGHGGMDGGAVGVNNKELEKDINLSIAKTLDELLRAAGYTTVMVRTEDVSIHDPQFTSVRQQKKSDIRNRLKLAEETPNSIYIGIHLNHFEKSKYNGAQMFFGRNNPESPILASILQEQFRTLLQPENTRETKAGGKNLYILKNATCPAVLVECGFLSNPAECSLLADEEYQRQVAFTIYTALLRYQEDEM